MADFYADRVAEGSLTQGLGTLTIDNSAPAGYRTLVTAGAVSTNTVVTLTTLGSLWEIARGTFTSPATLTRDTLLSSSTGAWIDWGVGAKTIRVVLASDTLSTILSKLAGIEENATADQTGGEIKSAYEAEANTNAYTDTEKSKLSGVESGATADQTKADIDALGIDAASIKSALETTSIEALSDGWYHWNGAAPTGAPWGTYGVLLQATDGAQPVQFCFGNTTGEWAVRRKNSGTWAAWAQSTDYLLTSTIGSTVQAYDADTAKTDIANSWTLQQTFKEVAETTFAFSGTVLDTANGTMQYITLSSNTTFTSALENGQSMTLHVADGTAYTITWPTIRWVGGVAPVLEVSGWNVIELWHQQGVLWGSGLGKAS